MSRPQKLLPLPPAPLALAGFATQPAAASTVRVEVSKETEREVTETFADVFVRARDDERNRMRVTPSGASLVIATLACPGDVPGKVRLSVSGRTSKPVAFSITRDEPEAAKLAIDERTVKRAKRQGRVPATLVVETLQPGAEVTRLVYRTEVNTGESVRMPSNGKRAQLSSDSAP